MDRLRARWLLALALIVAGLAVGVLGAFAYSLTEQKLYRARTALIAQTGSQPVTGGVLQTIRDLIRTDIVAQNVIRNQQLGESSSEFFDRLHVTSAGSVITVDVDDSSQDRAVRIAQELSLVFTQLVRSRFGSGADTAQVSIFDPAHAVGKVSPDTARDLGWGALFGALLGLLLANLLVLRGRRGVWLPAPYPYPEQPALEQGAAPRELAAAEPAPRLGGDPGETAQALIVTAADDPFQTVLVAGDGDGSITAAISEALAQRGELTMWVEAADADEKELDQLAARCAFVLVAAPEFDVELARRLDGVVAVTDGGAAPAWPGIRLIGTVGRWPQTS